MRTPSWLTIVPIVVVVCLMAMLASGWPGTVAQAADRRGASAAGRTQAVSQQSNDNSGGNGSYSSGDNEDSNSSADNEENQSSGDNGESDNNSDGNDDNDNANHENVNVVPVPVPVPVSQPAPPPPPGPSTSADQVSQCLSNGATLVYQGPEGGIAVKSFQDNLDVSLTRVDPGAQPLPPGQILSTFVFRMTASPCGGSPYTVLPSEVNLAVSYTDALAAGHDESRFALMYYNGSAWTVAPKLYRDAANNHVSASVTGLGVYALVQQ